MKGKGGKMMLVLSLLLITIISATYFILKFYFGTRIYFSETLFLTIREVLLPLLFVSFEIFSQLLLGRSLLPWIIVFSSLAGMLLLLVKKRNPTFYIRQFFYQFCSIEFLMLIIGHFLLACQFIYFLIAK